MKYVMLIGDGMADEPIPALGGQTPLKHLNLPGMARIAGGALGRIRTCPTDLPPGSDVAFLTLMGHNPAVCYTGRSPLEAAGEGVQMGEGEVSLRVNIISTGNEYATGTMQSYNGAGIAGDDARALMADLVADPEFAALMRNAGMRIAITDSFRHIAVMPADDEAFVLTPAHDIAGQPLSSHLPRGQKSELLRAMQARAHAVLNRHPLNARRRAQGIPPANGLWFWGAGRSARLQNFTEAYGLKGTVVSAVPLVRGIAQLSGLNAPRIPGATGELDTNYEGKLVSAISAIQSGDDFVLLHLEAPDDMSHLGNLEGKLEAIRRLDDLLVRPMLAALDATHQPYRALVMPDHYTLLSTRTHDGTPVPYAIFDSRNPGEPRAFCEQSCESAPVLEKGNQLIRQLIGR